MNNFWSKNHYAVDICILIIIIKWAIDTNFLKSVSETVLSLCVCQTAPAVLDWCVSVGHSGCCWWSTPASLQSLPGPGTCHFETFCWRRCLVQIKEWWENKLWVPIRSTHEICPNSQRKQSCVITGEAKTSTNVVTNHHLRTRVVKPN